jgi:hypothetical protein
LPPDSEGYQYVGDFSSPELILRQLAWILRGVGAAVGPIFSGERVGGLATDCPATMPGEETALKDGLRRSLAAEKGIRVQWTPVGEVETKVGGSGLTDSQKLTSHVIPAQGGNP